MTKCFSSNGPLLHFCLYVSNISLLWNSWKLQASSQSPSQRVGCLSQFMMQRFIFWKNRARQTSYLWVHDYEYSVLSKLIFSDNFSHSKPLFPRCFHKHQDVTSRGQTVPTLVVFLLLLLFLSCWHFYCSLLVSIAPPFSGEEECTTLTQRMVTMETMWAVTVATGILWYHLMR